METTHGEEHKRVATLPPRWFIRSFWAVQRALYSVTLGRFGLRAATADHQGMMRLRTIGRRTGEQRAAILSYFEDGPDLVTMAMNGWADPEPAWWLNLQAHPDVTVDLAGGSRAVHARAADKDERPRLWARWAGYDKDLRRLRCASLAGDSGCDPVAPDRATGLTANSLHPAPGAEPGDLALSLLGMAALSMWSETRADEGGGMDELIKELQERAGLSEEQAKAAAEVVAEWLRDDDKRKKVMITAVATTTASAVVTGAI